MKDVYVCPSLGNGLMLILAERQWVLALVMASEKENYKHNAFIKIFMLELSSSSQFITGVVGLTYVQVYCYVWKGGSFRDYKLRGNND